MVAIAKSIIQVCREWYRLCFDGQNWQTLDMREHYMEMPGEQLMRIISETGPFIKDLNLRYDCFL